MSETFTELPGNWSETETDYDFQARAWVNEATGKVLMLEVKQEQWHEEDEKPDYYLHLLPPDYESNPEPITTIIDQGKSLDDVIEEAHRFMAENQPP